MADEKPLIEVPQFCQRHQRQVVEAWKLGPHDPWRAGVIIATIAQFQACTADPDFHTRTGGDITHVTTIGCLACWQPERFAEILAAGMDGAKAKGESYLS